MKSISTINPAITTKMQSSIVKVCNPVIGLKVGVLLDHGQGGRKGRRIMGRGGGKGGFSPVKKIMC